MLSDLDGMKDAGKSARMSKASYNGKLQRSLAILTGTVLVTVIVGCLYWAQAIFIPLALATYLACVLSPLVNMLQRRRIGRVPAVLLVVAGGTVLLGGVGWTMSHEFSAVIKELPQYEGNIQQKVQSLRDAGAGTPFSSVARMMREILGSDDAPSDKGAAQSKEGHDDAGTDSRPRPAPVAIQPETPAWLSRLPSFLGSVAETLAALVLTFVLVIFMLLKREDLRNRMIRLVGRDQIALTTKALDEATQRISRFLLVQAIGNASFGLVLSIGLLIIGVPYALLWGFLAALLRYLPYVGTWIAALLPLLLSIATSDSWLPPLFVLALFSTIELIYSNAIEPRIFGHSMGVSAVALLVAAAVWAFLWGPIGLLLSNPLTVCLVVLGKYFPQMEVFNVLLGDEPALAPDVTFYQRLLARDQDEALQLVDAHRQNGPPEQVYDELLIPALTIAKRDHERDELTDDDEEFVLQATREIVADLGQRIVAQAASDSESAAPANGQSRVSEKLRVLGCPARDKADEVALEMFRQLLDPAKWEIDIASTEMLSSELVALAERERPALICISSLPPGGLSQARYLCKRVRAKLPEAKILVGRWGLTHGLDQNREQLREAGADEVDATLLATRQFLRSWFPVLTQAAKDSTPEAAPFTSPTLT
jgi:predicted PurR-regulated permease PerM